MPSLAGANRPSSRLTCRKLRCLRSPIPLAVTPGGKLWQFVCRPAARAKEDFYGLASDVCGCSSDTDARVRPWQQPDRAITLPIGRLAVLIQRPVVVSIDCQRRVAADDDGVSGN